MRQTIGSMLYNNGYCHAERFGIVSSLGKGFLLEEDKFNQPLDRDFFDYGKQVEWEEFITAIKKTNEIKEEIKIIKDLTSNKPENNNRECNKRPTIPYEIKCLKKELKELNKKSSISDEKPINKLTKKERLVSAFIYYLERQKYYIGRNPDFVEKYIKEKDNTYKLLSYDDIKFILLKSFYWKTKRKNIEILKDMKTGRQYIVYLNKASIPGVSFYSL